MTARSVVETALTRAVLPAAGAFWRSFPSLAGLARRSGTNRAQSRAWPDEPRDCGTSRNLSTVGRWLPAPNPPEDNP